jgi:ABC-type branched-subunit amino acid transport system ATPase component
VLLLDEPTEGLAPVIVQSLSETLHALCRTFGLSLLLAEQNILFALGFAQSIYVIEEGTIVWSGSTADFEADPSIRRRHLAV